MQTKSLTTTATNELTFEYLRANLRVNGKPVDLATARRIYNAKPRPSDNIEPLYYAPFRLLR